MRRRQSADDDIRIIMMYRRTTYRKLDIGNIRYGVEQNANVRIFCGLVGGGGLNTRPEA